MPAMSILQPVKVAAPTNRDDRVGQAGERGSDWSVPGVMDSATDAFDTLLPNWSFCQHRGGERRTGGVRGAGLGGPGLWRRQPW
jgi:hypothetical protein